MNIESNNPLPLHIARAYGLSAPARNAPVPVEVAREAVEAQRVEIRRELSNTQRNVSRLIAGVVPGGIDFTGETPVPGKTSALPFYSHPADRNAAATSIRIGRSIDVTG